MKEGMVHVDYNNISLEKVYNGPWFPWCSSYPNICDYELPEIL